MKLKPTLWVLPASLFVAMVFALWPLPSLLAVWRPDWVALVLLYWALASGRGMGPLLPFVMGVLVDVQTTSRLGLHALGFCLIIALAELMSRRLKIFSLWQTGMAVAVLLLILRLVLVGGGRLLGGPAPGLSTFLPVLSAALVWPLLVALLRRSRGY